MGWRPLSGGGCGPAPSLPWQPGFLHDRRTRLKTYERRIVIERAPEQVFEVLTNPTKVKSWNPDIVRLEPLADGPVRVGTRYSAMRDVGGKMRTAEMEVTVFEPPRRCGLGGTIMGVWAGYVFDLEPLPGGSTRVELTAEVRGRGIGRFIEGAFVKAMQRSDAELLERLKRAVEGAA